MCVCVCVWVCVCIYVYMSSLPSHTACSIHPYHPLLPGVLPKKYILGLHRAVIDKFLLIDQCSHVHRRPSVMSSSLLLPQYPTCLVHHTLMVLETEGKCLHSCCFVECCFQDLFSIAHNILVQFPYICMYMLNCLLYSHTIHTHMHAET